MRDKVLEVRNLSLNIRNGKKKVPILRDISFELYHGQRLGIVGNSGAGKSMTMYALANLLPEKETEITGSIIYNGTDDILTMPAKEKRKFCSEHVAIILQDSMNALNPYRKIGAQMEENILHFHPAMNRADARQKIQDVLQLMGIRSDSRTLNQYPGQFSGGMRQRIAIAMALESNAKILIADEPTTSLDAVNQMNFVKLLQNLCDDRGLALLFISHNPGLVSMLCEEVLVVDDGIIMDRGETADVFARQRQRFYPDTDIVKGGRIVMEDSWRHGEMSGDDSSDLSYCQKAESSEGLAANQRKMVLELQNVQKRYVVKHRMGMMKDHVFPAVKGVSFGLLEGETLGLVGESGCGKTTLARMIVRLLRPDGGDILYRGQSILGMPDRDFRRLRPKIQLIQQNPFSSLDPEMKVFDILSEGIDTHQINTDGQSVRQYLADILQECGLQENMMDRYPHEFSGGQLQRLSIARAVALKPDVLIADEIVSALDVSVQNQILSLLQRLKMERKMSVIFISHDLCVVRRISDKIAVMKDGEIVDYGYTEDIFTHSDCAWTQRLKAAIILPPQ